MLTANISDGLGSYKCLSLRDIIIAILNEGMNLVNYILILENKNIFGPVRDKDLNPTDFDNFKELWNSNTKQKIHSI